MHIRVSSHLHTHILIPSMAEAERSALPHSESVRALDVLAYLLRNLHSHGQFPS